MRMNEINTVMANLNPEVIAVEEVDAMRFRGDLLGLLDYKGIDIEHKDLILKVNNIDTNAEFSGESGILKYYKSEEVETFLNNLS